MWKEAVMLLRGMIFSFHLEGLRKITWTLSEYGHCQAEIQTKNLPNEVV
jgi:hypothetical protein